jgi:hypothetical protein
LTKVYDVHVSNQQFAGNPQCIASSANVAHCIGAW